MVERTIQTRTMAPLFCDASIKFLFLNIVDLP